MTDIFLKILNISITASYLVVAVFLLRLILKKAPKWIRGILWGLVGIRLVFPFSVESVLSIIPSAEVISSDTVKYSTAPTITSGIPIIDSSLNPVISTTFSANPTQSVNPLQILTEMAGLIWVVGIAVMLMYAIISTLKIKKQVGESVKIRDNIFMCDAVKSPFILGVIRPKIYIPSGMDSDAENLIISHELAHIKRGDHFWKPFGFLLLSVYWFNPLIWFGYVFLCRDIELACDEKVIKSLGKDEIADYSEALLKFNAPRKLITACPVAFGEVGVKERIKSVLNYKKPAFWIIIVAIVACAVTAICLLTNPYSDNKIDDKMKITMDMAIAEHNKSDRNEGEFSACAYDIFGVKKQGNKTTVYSWVLYEEYSFNNNEIKNVSGSSCPVVFTVDTSKNGDSSAYKLIEYWTPRDGSYYSDDIKDKFLMKMWSKVFNHNVDSLQEKCFNDAKKYFDSQSENNVKVTDNKGGIHFKTGTWTTSEGRNYVFYENGKDGKTVNVFEGTGIGFEYELDAYGKGVFHMGSADDVTKVSVVFAGGGDDTVAIYWEDGSRSVLMFVSSDTSDNFAYNYKMGQITKSQTAETLQNKYPEFFGLNAKSGLTVYIWQTGEWNYRCFLMSSIDAAKIDLTGAFEKCASIGEMRAILDFYGISKDKITITPVRNPLSSYYVPNLDEAYSKKLETIFWANDDATEPPELTVQDGRSIITAQKGTYSWTGKDAATGNMVTINGDAAFAFNAQKDKLPTITVSKSKSKYQNYDIILQFNFLQPDTVRISYYDEQGNKIFFSDKLSFELKTGSYVYEVDAFFGDNRVQYGFVGCRG